MRHYSSRGQLIGALLCACALLPLGGRVADGRKQVDVQKIVARAVTPVMQKYKILGMAIAVVSNGKSFVYNFGTAEKASGTKVSGRTLFEIGSVSKTFTATLTPYAQVTGHLSLADRASK